MKYDYFSPSKNLGTFQLKQLKKEIFTVLLLKFNLLFLEPWKSEVFEHSKINGLREK